MPLFSDLADASITSLQALEDVVERSLPEQLSRVRREKIILEGRAWQVGDYGELRNVLIQSPKIEIINLFFFPTPSYSVPIYALDFVVLAGRPLVGMIDLVGLNDAVAEAQAKRWLREAHRRFPLPQAADLPAWYQACRSGEDFFIRPDSLTQLQQLRTVHEHLWKNLTALLLGQVADSNAVAAREQALQAYKQHHHMNVPGLPLLNKTFGETWTQRFLSEFLFA